MNKSCLTPITGRKSTVAKMFCLMCSFTFGLVLANQIACADAVKSEGKEPRVDNIGFMVNPPKALKEQFPMCDEFLNVTWVDKKKRVGYSRYQIYTVKHVSEGGNTREERSRRTLFALIYLDDTTPLFDLELDRWERDPQLSLDKLFSEIREGDLEINLVIPSDPIHLALWIKRPGDKAAGFMTGIDGVPEFDEADEFSLAEHRENICIPYPDNQRMWLAETRLLSKTDVLTQTAGKRRTSWQNEIDFVPGISYMPIDFNYDGIIDFYGGAAVFIYSFQNSYDLTKMESAYHKDKVSGIEMPYNFWRFSATGKICELNGHVESVYLTTDGKNYFLNNRCNLTQAMTK